MSRYYEDAVELRAPAHCVGKQDRPPAALRRVLGGGPGIMEAANRAQPLPRDKTIGLNISLPFEQYPNPYIPPRTQFRVPLLLHAEVLVRVSCQSGW